MVTHDQGEALSVSDRVVVMDHGHVTQIGSPLEVYEQPETRFVSTFVGHTNLMAGQWVDRGMGVRFALGELELDLPAPSTLQPTPGAPALISVRPEKIQFKPRGSGRLDGQVQERFFLGSQWLYRVTSAHGDWFITSPNDGRPTIAPGDWAALDWSAQNVRFLAADRAVDSVEPS